MFIAKSYSGDSFKTVFREAIKDLGKDKKIVRMIAKYIGKKAVLDLLVK